MSASSDNGDVDEMSISSLSDLESDVNTDDAQFDAQPNLDAQGDGETNNERQLPSAKRRPRQKLKKEDSYKLLCGLVGSVIATTELDEVKLGKLSKYKPNITMFFKSITREHSSNPEDDIKSEWQSVRGALGRHQLAKGTYRLHVIDNVVRVLENPDTSRTFFHDFNKTALVCLTYLLLPMSDLDIPMNTTLSGVIEVANMIPKECITFDNLCDTHLCFWLSYVYSYPSVTKGIKAEFGKVIDRWKYWMRNDEAELSNVEEEMGE